MAKKATTTVKISDACINMGFTHADEVTIPPLLLLSLSDGDGQGFPLDEQDAMDVLSDLAEGGPRTYECAERHDGHALFIEAGEDDGYSDDDDAPAPTWLYLSFASEFVLAAEKKYPMFFEAGDSDACTIREEALKVNATEFETLITVVRAWLMRRGYARKALP